MRKLTDNEIDSDEAFEETLPMMWRTRFVFEGDKHECGGTFEHSEVKGINYLVCSNCERVIR